MFRPRDNPVTAVLRNNLNVAVGRFLRQRKYSLLNVFGLAVAFACTLVIGLFVAEGIPVRPPP